MVVCQCAEKRLTRIIHHYLRYSVLAVSLAAIAGCGGGGGGNGVDPNTPPQINTGISSLSISGLPSNEAYYASSSGDIYYEFKPQVSLPLDDIIFTINKKPSWASFDEKTGSLSGIPKESDSGLYPEIIISATKGKETKSLPPFTIEVKRWDKYSFCSAQSKKDSLTHCSVISKNYTSQSGCELWAQFDSPSLDLSTLKVNAASKNEINLIAQAYCHQQEPVFDSSRGACPSGYIAVEQVSKDSVTGLTKKIDEPRCMKNLTAEQAFQELSNTIEEDLQHYANEYSNYAKRADALNGFEPLLPTITGPDSNGKLVVTLPPAINLQHKVEKQRREMDDYLSKVAKGLSYQDPNVSVGLCPGLSTATGWNQGVCFYWEKLFGDETTFALRTEAMGMLRASGESAAQLTATAQVFDLRKNIVDFNGQSRLWTTPAANNYFSLSTHSAQSSLQKINQQVTSIGSEFKSLHDQVKGSAFRQRVNILGSVQQQYERPQEGNANLVWQTQPFTVNQTFMEGIKHFMIGPIPVSVAGSVSGNLNAQAGGSLENQLTVSSATVQADSRLAGNIDSGFGLTAKADAGVDVLIAKAGVEGTVQVFDAKMPLKVDASVKELMKKQLPPKLQLDWQATILAGKIDAVVKVKNVVNTSIRVLVSKLNILGKFFKWKEINVPEVREFEYRRSIWNHPGIRIGYNATAGKTSAARTDKLAGYVPIYCSRGAGECFVETPSTPRIINTVDLLIDNQWGLKWLISRVSQFSYSGGDPQTAWYKANRYCQTLGARLPTASELALGQDYLTSTFRVQHAFTSTTTDDQGKHWTLDLGSGLFSGSNYPDTGPLDALCVKD